MADLNERLAEADRSVVIRDTVRLIDSEVASKGGVTGYALKGGYKVVKKLRGGRMIEQAVDHLLDDFTGALNPMFQEYIESDVDLFENYLKVHIPTAAAALLSITDDRIQEAENRVIIKTYEKLRPTAKRHVEEALPGVGRLIDTYAPK